MSDRSWHRWLVVVALAGLCGTVLPVLLAWPRLPEPMAVHWSMGMQPDGAMSKRSFVAPAAVLIVIMLCVVLHGAAAATARGRGMRLALITYVSGTAVASAVTLVARNLDKAHWREAEPLTAAWLALVLCVPLAAAAVAYALAARAWGAHDARAPVERSALPLAADARVYWSGSASNGWLLGIGGALLLQAVVLAQLPGLRSRPWWLALLVVVAVVLEAFSRIRVTVDARGLTVSYGRLAVWRRLVPLATIERSRAVKLDALEHGGWGYRGGLRWLGKAAIVVRSGDALELALRDGKRLFVTVDDAGTAAELVNGLVERARAAAASKPETIPT